MGENKEKLAKEAAEAATDNAAEVVTDNAAEEIAVNSAAEVKKNTAAEEQVISYSECEEVFDAGEVKYTELREEEAESYGDVIIEEFSAESNVPRLSRITRIPENVMLYIFAVVYLVVGVVCVAIPEHVASVLPYIVGGMMIVIGLAQFIVAVIRKEYKQIKTNRTATSLIIVALGIMIFVEHFNASEWAITFISIIWGILGLFEGAHAFNHAFKRIAEGERCVYYIIKGIIECVVAFMLLYQPSDHDIHHFHIIVFGINLIFDSITMMPKVKSFISMK